MTTGSEWRAIDTGALPDRSSAKAGARGAAGTRTGSHQDDSSRATLPRSNPAGSTGATRVIPQSAAASASRVLRSRKRPPSTGGQGALVATTRRFITCGRIANAFGNGALSPRSQQWQSYVEGKGVLRESLGSDYHRAISSRSGQRTRYGQ